MAKSLDQCRKHGEIIRWAKREGLDVKHGKRHDKICTDDGFVTVPRHPGDLKRGTLRSIVKGLRVLGLAVMAPLACNVIMAVLK